jgi:hypothetical protein
MTHWTSHAFHATVVSPRGMYEDVTMGFSDGSVIFTGRPLRNWRAWSWIGLVVRLALIAGGLVALAAAIAPAVFARELSSDVVLRACAVVAVWALCMWIGGVALRRLANAARMRSTERVSKVPVSDVSTAKLSGRTLSLRAPFDQQNTSGRWRLRLESHDQGESLLALLGRR